ncbi:hypothetical protein GCM10023213_27070 [Prosthecobacter algae]|uniref:DUF5077 domain-containing protein n=1 Tax=Prosthecobacter algae TaxID=1144682 RepID=A0ABP9P788_9BACT
MIRTPLSVFVLPLALSLSSCGPKPESQVTQEKAPAPQAEASKAEDKPAPAVAETAPKPATAPAVEPEIPSPPVFKTAVDIGDFGSAEPAERKDMPTRGIVVMGPESWEHSNGAHWETYTGTKFKAKRWGRYKVRLTYSLNRATLGMQFRMANLVVKKSLANAPTPRKTYLGEIYVAQPGDLPFALLTPPTDNGGFVLHELALIPTCEGETPKQAEDGSITLSAKDAITWSENMRYEPKPEKNCLGYWTSEDDLAEWEFEVRKPGRYKVTVSHGCGGGNHGSEVELQHADQTLKFTTQDTGGFQNWKELPLGEIEIKATGKQRLRIDPVNKVKSAVLDVQKVVLTPVG